MTEQIHLAAQYLAAAGISFLEKKEDDSHTNLGFSVESGSLYSRPLNDTGNTLSLNYKNFTLEWNTYNSSAVFRLDDRTHLEVLEWIRKMSAINNISTPYSYDFHYELPYQITNGFTFKISNPYRLREALRARILAQNVLEVFRDNQKLKTEVRVWPHHMDTGAFVPLENGSGLSVSIGLAIPDKLFDGYYFYISVYKGHRALDICGFPDLAIGEWYDIGFKGAILPTKRATEFTAYCFFEETLKAYETQAGFPILN